jgi:uncharacterized membrane protein YfcA
MLATIAQALVATGLGTAGGIVGGLFGIGGGVLLIPVIGMLYGLDQQVAQGTTLIMVVPNVLFAWWGYRRRVGVDLRMAATLGLSALVATYPVARIATGLDPHDLRLAFAGFLVLLAAIIAWRTLRGAGQPSRRPPLAWGWSAVLGLAGGVVSGLFGVGGAFIAPPVLTAFFGVRQIEAQGLALALVFPGTFVALATYAGAGQVDWQLGVPLAIGGIAAIPLGVAAAHRLPEQRLRLAFCIMLVFTAGLLALHA